MADLLTSTEPYFKETRGGMRANSSTMHQHKVEREFTCAWCGEKFTSIQPSAKYCSAAHRHAAFRSVPRLGKPKVIPRQKRRGKGYRPPLALILQDSDS